MRSQSWLMAGLLTEQVSMLLDEAASYNDDSSGQIEQCTALACFVLHSSTQHAAAG